MKRGRRRSRRNERPPAEARLRLFVKTIRALHSTGLLDRIQQTLEAANAELRGASRPERRRSVEQLVAFAGYSLSEHGVLPEIVSEFEKVAATRWMESLDASTIDVPSVLLQTINDWEAAVVGEPQSDAEPTAELSRFIVGGAVVVFDAEKLPQTTPIPKMLSASFVGAAHYLDGIHRRRAGKQQKNGRRR